MKCATWFGAASASRSSTIVPSLVSSTACLFAQLRRRQRRGEERIARRRGRRPLRRGACAIERSEQQEQRTSAQHHENYLLYSQWRLSASSIPGTTPEAPQYEEFYGFAQSPFTLAPDPRFLYPSESHDDAIQQLLAGHPRQGRLHRPDRRHRHRQDDALPGAARAARHDARSRRSSSTRSCRSTSCCARSCSTSASSRRTPCAAAASSPRQQARPDQHAARLPAVAGADRRQRRADHRRGAAPVAEVLEQIRVISNLETNQSKLLQIVLVGQLNLLDGSPPERAAARSARLAARHADAARAARTSRPTSRTGCRSRADRRRSPSTRRRSTPIYASSEGVPRVINLLCDRALMHRRRLRPRMITADVVSEAADDLALRTRHGSALDGRAPWTQTPPCAMGCDCCGDHRARSRALLLVCAAVNSRFDLRCCLSAFAPIFPRRFSSSCARSSCCRARCASSSCSFR